MAMFAGMMILRAVFQVNEYMEGAKKL